MDDQDDANAHSCCDAREPLPVTVSPITLAAILGNAYDAVSSTIGLVAVLLLIFVLIGKEVARARGVAEREVIAWDVAIVPLTVAVGVVYGLRLIDLIA